MPPPIQPPMPPYPPPPVPPAFIPPTLSPGNPANAYYDAIMKILGNPKATRQGFSFAETTPGDVSEYNDYIKDYNDQIKEFQRLGVQSYQDKVNQINLFNAQQQANDAAMLGYMPGTDNTLQNLYPLTGDYGYNNSTAGGLQGAVLRPIEAEIPVYQNTQPMMNFMQPGSKSTSLTVNSANTGSGVKPINYAEPYVPVPDISNLNNPYIKLPYNKYSTAIGQRINDPNQTAMWQRNINEVMGNGTLINHPPGKTFTFDTSSTAKKRNEQATITEAFGAYLLDVYENAAAKAKQALQKVGKSPNDLANLSGMDIDAYKKTAQDITDGLAQIGANIDKNEWALLARTEIDKSGNQIKVAGGKKGLATKVETGNSGSIIDPVKGTYYTEAHLAFERYLSNLFDDFADKNRTYFGKIDRSNRTLNGGDFIVPRQAGENLDLSPGGRFDLYEVSRRFVVDALLRMGIQGNGITRPNERPENVKNEIKKPDINLDILSRLLDMESFA